MTDPAAGGLRSHRPVTFIVTAVAAIALGGAAGYLLENRVGENGRESLSREVARSEVERLKQENRRLNARVAELEMSRRLDRQAYGEVERTLGDLQSRLARQGDDLAFYRSIVSPADGVQGLRIQKIAVEAGAQQHEFVLRLTLVQAMRHESVVSGLAQVTLVGLERDVPARHTLGDLLDKPRAQLPFSFRYFQTIEQALTLPDGFQPYEIEVRLQSSKLRIPLVQAFPWPPARPPSL